MIQLHPHIRRRPFERACRAFGLELPVRLKLTARMIKPLNDDEWAVTYGTYRPPNAERDRDHHLILLNSVYLPAYRNERGNPATVIDRTVCHELQHAKQYESGEFIPSGDVERHDDPAYLQNPSEIDARAAEQQAMDFPRIVVLSFFNAASERLWTPPA